MLILCSTRSGHFGVLGREHRRRRDIGHRRLELVLPACDDIAFPVHHGVETDLRDVGRVVLLSLTNVRASGK